MMSDLGSRAPKYQRIADELRREIKAGVYQPGERLPSEAALLDRFRRSFPTLALPTLRQAIGVLRTEGIIESRHGVGTFVAQNRRLQRRSRHRYGRARADSQLLTSHLRHEILFAGITPPPAHIGAAAGLREGDEVVTRQRLLFDTTSGQPQEWGASYLPAWFAGGTFLAEPAVVPKALFLCVEDVSGKRYATAHDRWIARAATPREAELLRLPQGAPVMHLIHVARSDDDTLLEVSESVWPADRIEVIDEYAVAHEAEQAAGLSDI